MTVPAPAPYFPRTYFPSIASEVFEALSAASIKISARVQELVRLPPPGGIDDAVGGSLDTRHVGSIAWPITDESVEAAAKLIADELIASIVVDGATYTATARAAVVVPNAELASGCTSTSAQLNIVTQLVK